jgi:CHAD domain-containing protein
MVVDKILAPEHLLSSSWLELEKAQASRVFSDLEKMLGKLSKKLTEKRVHDVRVALRRWYSVWDILAIDGWENSGYPDGGFEKSIGCNLRKINKNLGQLRDLDVSLSLARDLHINQFVVRHLSKKRKKLTRKVQKEIAKLNPDKLINRLRSYLAGKSHELQYSAKNGTKHSNGDHSPLQDSLPLSPELSAFKHMNQFLLQSEHHCRLLCENSRGNDELHELRLSIKRWRYLLSEFLGLTNLELVNAQQILGRIRDLYGLREDIEHLKRPLAKAFAKDRLSRDDLKADKELIATTIEQQFVLLAPVIERLPFGLRPYSLSRPTRAGR